MKPLGSAAYQLAKAVRVPAPRINDIVLEKRGITAHSALRLAKFFGTSDLFWMNLQASYELRKPRAALGEQLKQIRPRAAHRAA